MSEFGPVIEALAEHRRRGVEFEAAWPTVLASQPGSTREVLSWTAGAWRRAYQREPPLPGDAPELTPVGVLSDS